MRTLKYGIVLFIGVTLGTLASPLTFPMMKQMFPDVPPTTTASGNRVPELQINLPANHQTAESRVLIWKSSIPPHQSAHSDLPLHRHNYSRVLVPLTEGTLTRKDLDGTITTYNLVKGKPLFLPADSAEGFHTDENEGQTMIEVNVIQFNYPEKISVQKLTTEDLDTAVQKYNHGTRLR